MSQIVETSLLAPDVKQFRIVASKIAAKQRAGQFVIVSVDEDAGERIPLTIAGADAEKGTVRLIFQRVGKATAHMATLDIGASLVISPARSASPPI